MKTGSGVTEASHLAGLKITYRTKHRVSQTNTTDFFWLRIYIHTKDLQNGVTTSWDY